MPEVNADFNSEWPALRLIDVAGYQNGHAFYKDGYSDHGLIAIDLFNVDEEGKLRFSARDKYVSPELCEKYARFKLNKGDLVIVMTDMTQAMGILGKSAIIDKDDAYILNQRIGRIVPDSEKVDTRYLHYFINSPLFLRPLHQLAKGAVQKYVNTGDIKEARVSVPPLFIQCRIADILAKYDDLIENNTRRIEILEEMARRLYEEWFVHFRFPGHEEVSFKESELGRIPEGWEIANLEEVVDLTMGQSPKSEFYNDTGEGLPFHQGVTDFGSYFPSNRLYCTVKNRIAEEGDILFSVRAPVGRINIAKEKIVIGRGVSALRSKAGHQVFLLSQLRKIFEEEDSIGNGAIFKAVTKKDMQTIKLLQPDAHYIDSFESIAGSVWKQIRVLSDKNINLRAQRDLLLPKLVSGEIDVSEINQPALEAAE